MSLPTALAFLNIISSNNRPREVTLIISFSLTLTLCGEVTKVFGSLVVNYAHGTVGASNALGFFNTVLLNFFFFN